MLPGNPDNDDYDTNKKWIVLSVHHNYHLDVNK